jgi:uncharacterized membrane protein YfcA
MPRSKQRKRHHEPQRSASLVKTNKKRSTVNAGIIFFALVGLGIAYFATDASILWIVIGAVIGGACGYFFGKEMDKALLKEKK